MIEVKKLFKKYGNVTGVENVSFQLSDKEIVGFIGPNGAGKSTTMNMMTGCLAPGSGEIIADDISLSEKPVEYKKLIGYLPENPPLYNELTVTEFLKIVLKLKKSKLDCNAHINDIIEQFGLSEVRHRVIGNLSKGYRQRVGLASAFTGNPKYVILDEPTVGLDPIQKKQTLELIKKLSKHCGILLSSHILSEISFVCDRIIIIDNGSIVKQIGSSEDNKNTYKYKLIGNERRIVEILSAVPGVEKVVKGKNEYYVEADEACLSEISLRLSDERIPIVGLELYRVDVEAEFLNATARRKEEI